MAGSQVAAFTAAYGINSRHAAVQQPKAVPEAPQCTHRAACSMHHQQERSMQ